MVDHRYEKINELFIQFSIGNFDYRVDVSEELDEIDAFISNINMLGEELKEKTISKDFFNSIFNSVSDLIFVLDITGRIVRINKVVVTKMGLQENEIEGMKVEDLFEFENQAVFRFEEIIQELDKHLNFQLSFIYRGENIPALCSFSKLISSEGDHVGFILILKDISNIRELEETLMISEDKYHKLFEESSDTIIIINHKGKIIEINSVGKKMLGIDSAFFSRSVIYSFVKDEAHRKFIKSEISKKANINNIKIRLKNKLNENDITCYLSATKISHSEFYQVILKDITEQIELENLVIRTITDTQENERIRLARDIHDSLGQQLSAIKFYLSALSSNKLLDEKNQKLLERSEEGIKQILASAREICFNLMPQTIENFGLVAAVEELCKNSSAGDKIKFKISCDANMVRLTRDKEISIFRITQEFINNSIKHSHSKNIRISFKMEGNKVKVVLRDDGIGFEPEKTILTNQGMGLKNALSRVKSHNGDLKIISRVGSGVRYELTVPVH